MIRIAKLFAYLSLAILLPLWLFNFPNENSSSSPVIINQIHLDSLLDGSAEAGNDNDCWQFEKKYDSIDSVFKVHLLNEHFEKQEKKSAMITYVLDSTRFYEFTMELKPGQSDVSFLITNNTVDPILITGIDTVEYDTPFFKKYKFQKDDPFEQIPSHSSIPISFSFDPSFKGFAPFLIKGTDHRQREMKIYLTLMK